MSTTNDTTKQHHMRLVYTFLTPDEKPKYSVVSFNNERRLTVVHQDGKITGALFNLLGDSGNLNEAELFEIHLGIERAFEQKYKYEQLAKYDNNPYVEMLRNGAKIETEYIRDIGTSYRVNGGEWLLEQDDIDRTDARALDYHPYITSETIERGGEWDGPIMLLTYNPPQPCPTCGEIKWESINKPHTVTFAQRCMQCGHVIEGGSDAHP